MAAVILEVPRSEVETLGPSTYHAVIQLRFTDTTVERRKRQHCTRIFCIDRSSRLEHRSAPPPASTDVGAHATSQATATAAKTADGPAIKDAARQNITLQSQKMKVG